MIAPAAATFGIRWYGSSILFSLGHSIQSVDVNTRILTLHVKAGADEIVAHPQMLDEGHLMHTVRAAGAQWADSDIVVQPLAGGRRIPLVKGGTAARVLPNGYLIYARDATLFALAFDTGSMRTTGQAVRVLSDVVPCDGTGDSHIGISDEGTIAYFQGTQTFPRLPVWVNRAGVEEIVGPPARRYLGARISPNGQRIAFEVGGVDANLLVWGVQIRNFLPLTTPFEVASNPVWFDNETIIYRSNPAGSVGLFRRAGEQHACGGPRHRRSGRRRRARSVPQPQVAPVSRRHQ